MGNNGKLFIGMFATALVCGFVFYLQAIAFNGPSQTAPNGYGTLAAGTGNNTSIGTSTPAATTTLLVVGSTTDNTAFAFEVSNSAGGALLTVRNDGVVSAGSSVISGGSFTGAVVAGNISAGQFGSNEGGGNYSFPAALTATSGTVALASTTVTGNTTTTSLTVTGVTNAMLSTNGSGAVVATSSYVRSLGSATGTIAIGAYLSGGSTLNVSSTLASSSVSFIFANATTTKPYSFEDIQTANKKSIASVNCFEYAAATTTIELYYNTTNASTGIQQVILSSIACGIAGASTASFTTSTLPSGAYLFAIVSSIVGTPTETILNVNATTQ